MKFRLRHIEGNIRDFRTVPRHIAEKIKIGITQWLEVFFLILILWV